MSTAGPRVFPEYPAHRIDPLTLTFVQYCVCIGYVTGKTEPHHLESQVVV